MKLPAHILAVLDHSDSDSILIAKAATLVRQLDARLELFLCDAEHAYALKHEYEPRHNEQARQACLAEATQYLNKLRASVELRDIDTSVSAACESPLFEGIVHQVLQSRPDLVIKHARSTQPADGAVFDPNDWQLMRKCPTTLILTRGRRWHTPPRFAAAVDISAHETPGLALSILRTAQVLRAVHGGMLDVLYVERGRRNDGNRETHAAALLKLAEQSHVDQDDLHILTGNPEQILPAYIREHDYDVLALGALTHRQGAVKLVGALTSKLVDAVDCDFVLVKANPLAQPAAMSIPPDMRAHPSQPGS